MKNILFITWDGPQTSYMEGLFMPIFAQIQKQSSYRFHVIQFTWGAKKRLLITEKKANELNIIYTAKKVFRYPNSTIGSLLTVYSAIPFINKYIDTHAIDIVMPRSIIPSIMVNRLKKSTYKILFDADGLPIEERVDFSGLKKSSYLYTFLKNEEKSLLKKAETVITRSKKAIKFHLEHLDYGNSDKFFVVTNGRDINFFKSNADDNKQIRMEFDLKIDTKVFLYCGSLGPQYGWDIMIKIFKRYLLINHNSVFVILTGNEDFAKKRIPTYLLNHIIIKTCTYEEVPKYLAIGDVAFAIRDPKPSMQGVAPIKLGEYLLMGIPTIASSGIGDTDEILSKNKNCFLFDHMASDVIDQALLFIDKTVEFKKDEIREFGIHHFSIESSASSYLNAINNCS